VDIGSAGDGDGHHRRLRPAGLAGGRWRTYDDRTGVAKSIVVISEANGVLTGRVETVFAPPAPSANPLCDLCPGELKGQPVVGMRVLWDMKKEGGEYTGGRVLDPEHGKIYRGKVRLIDGGKKLALRGYIGFSMIGRTQTWVREP
jgi:uncharacterized protein (DUF2147 family)